MIASFENSPESAPADAAEWTPQRRWAWWAALGIALLLLALLDWLLARLLWLPMYFGLFFFLVAGLLVGGIAFRFARSARPLTRARIVAGVLPITLVSTCFTVLLEYRHIAAITGAPPAFGAAWAAKSKDGDAVGDIRTEATRAFRDYLAEEFPPGGVIGYARWATDSGKMDIRAFEYAETVTIAHQSYAWPIRTLAAFVLLALGLWLSFESLRSESPVSNIIAEGEEYEEIE